MPAADGAFAEPGFEPAICRSAAAADRGSATRLLIGHLAAPGVSLPDTSKVGAPGRVHGLGTFTSDPIGAALAAALPAEVSGSLRPDFEWYACRGAFFHNDAHYGEVLFGAWCVAGPWREIVFSRAGVRVPAGPGNFAVFDPFEPHAVLDTGADRYLREHYEGSPVSLFIGFELRLNDKVRQVFGIGPAWPGGPVLSSRVAIHAETGALD